MSEWPPHGFYAAYSVLSGFVLGAAGAVTSLLFNVIGSAIVNQNPLQLIRVYLTFPLGEPALHIESGLALAVGCTLYLLTGMCFGIPFQLVLSRWFDGSVFGIRFAVVTIMALRAVDHQLLRIDNLAPAASHRRELDTGQYPLVGCRLDAPRVWLDHACRAAPGKIRFGSNDLDGEIMTEPTPVLSLPSPKTLVIEKLVRWYFLASLTYLALALLAGLLMALQLVNHNPLRGIELLSPGRWRMVHTNAIAYGFIANAFLGILHWVVPRLTLRPVFDARLSWFIFGAWQVVVTSTAVGILLGQAQGVEWGETPVWIDPLALAGLLLVVLNFMVPIFQRPGPLYVSLWYFLAALVWTPLTYAMGNFIPQYFVGGTGGGAIGGLFIHDLVGLFVTPIGWGMMYYFVPIILKKPIWSHGLSLVGFWGLAFFYPLTGIHHFLYTPIPMFLQYGAVISTIAVEMVVTTVIINFIATMWGRTEDTLPTCPFAGTSPASSSISSRAFSAPCKRR